MTLLALRNCIIEAPSFISFYTLRLECQHCGLLTYGSLLPSPFVTTTGNGSMALS